MRGENGLHPSVPAEEWELWIDSGYVLEMNSRDWMWGRCKVFQGNFQIFVMSKWYPLIAPVGGTLLLEKFWEGESRILIGHKLA